MILNCCTDRKKTKPTIYVKLLKQVRLPSSLFGSELGIIGQSQLTTLERCQRWFLQKIISFTKIHKWPRFNESVWTEID